MSNRAKVGITPAQLAAVAGYPDAKVLHAYVDDDPQVIWVVMEDDEFPEIGERYPNVNPEVIEATIVRARPIPTTPPVEQEQPTWS